VRFLEREAKPPEMLPDFFRGGFGPRAREVNQGITLAVKWLGKVQNGPVKPEPPIPNVHVRS